MGLHGSHFLQRRRKRWVAYVFLNETWDIFLLKYRLDGLRYPELDTFHSVIVVIYTYTRGRKVV